MSSNRTAGDADSRTGSEPDSGRLDDEQSSEESVAERADLEARNELLAEQNRQLREAYREATQARYRRTALGLFVIGVLALVGAYSFPDIRTVLVALGGTGVFAGVLTYFLTPERFISVSVSGTVFDALAGNEAAVVTELGLADVRVYVPTADGARLFVPQFAAYGLPDAEALASTFVVTDDEATRGVALDPTGGGLYEAFDRGRSGPPPEEPIDVARQLGDAAVEQFELLDVAAPEQGGEDRIVVGAGNTVYGSLTDFDHPVPSLLAVGLARDMGTPVTVAVEPAEDDRYDALVVCSWGQ